MLTLSLDPHAPLEIKGRFRTLCPKLPDQTLDQRGSSPLEDSACIDKTTIETRIGLPQWRQTRGCRATADIRARSPTRIFASALCCDVIVAGLRAQAILLTESEAVVHELTVTTKIEHVRVHELLLAQKRKVAGGASCGGGDR